MARLIKVRAANNDGRVVLWEIHPLHPNCEVFITGNGKAVDAARTEAVMTKLHRGELVEVKPEPKPEAAPAKKGKAK